ncbi:septation protein IspZ [Sandaracinobacteroides saxicola]|uniref:Septation protein IspZ n=1 Tax=Sandaracinobacteroides saxicola TaxID=2759707 RepID=A0A7G5IL72_9SPHN|nr:septation protein IspZ [Sandaracinobacteroides saxicola]QMW24114.1 septation protein IspZ [Sandaracinobacteroides saxicola]
MAIADHFRRNAPSIAVDVGLLLLFYALAKTAGLIPAAFGTAATGLALALLQRVVTPRIMGGLGLFAMVMLLLSGLYAVAFDAEDAIKLRPMLVGLVASLLFLLDARFAGGRWLAGRLATYLPFDGLNLPRLGTAFGLLGFHLAALNGAIALAASIDVWLLYNSFGELLLTLAGLRLVIRHARQKGAVSG